MYQPSAKKATITQHERRQRLREENIQNSAAEAIQADTTRRNKRVPNLEFPAPTANILAIEKKRINRNRKTRKGNNVIPREIKRLAYKGPKLSPVAEETNEGDMQEDGELVIGGMPPLPSTTTLRPKRTRSMVVPNFIMDSLAEETEEEVKVAAKDAARAPTLSDMLKYNPDYPKLKVPRTRRKGKRSILGYAPDEDNLGPLDWGGGRKQKRRRSSRKTRRSAN